MKESGIPWVGQIPEEWEAVRAGWVMYEVNNRYLVDVDSEYSMKKKVRIPRDLYVDDLMSRRLNGFVKIITGVRRCGKSYLLNTLFRERLEAEGVKPSQIVMIV